jgi:hypothetical protein
MPGEVRQTDKADIHMYAYRRWSWVEDWSWTVLDCSANPAEKGTETRSSYLLYVYAYHKSRLLIAYRFYFQGIYLTCVANVAD